MLGSVFIFYVNYFFLFKRTEKKMKYFTAEEMKKRNGF